MQFVYPIIWTGLTLSYTVEEYWLEEELESDNIGACCRDHNWKFDLGLSFPDSGSPPRY
jgi:hypothetical protein